MKKLLFVMVLVMGALVVNAQRTPVKVADLQKSITDNIAKDYTGFTIKEAESVTKNNTLTYHVVIVKDATTETLVYDKSGVFVKKLPPPAAAPAAAPVKK